MISGRYIESVSTKETFAITRCKYFQLWKQSRFHINVSAKDSQRFLNYIRKASESSKRVFKVFSGSSEYFILVKGLRFKEETGYKKAHAAIRCLELNNLEVLQTMNGLEFNMKGLHGDVSYSKGLMFKMGC